MSLNRRHFLFGALAAPVLAATKKQTVAARPNIVLIVAEDLGAYMVGCYANSEVRTPNIDRLAQTGVRFHNSFSCSPVVTDQTAFAAAGYNCARSSSDAQAAGFLDAQAPAKPFFLAVAWPSPNAVAASQKNLELYSKTGFETVGWDFEAANATHKEMLRDIPGNLRKYAAALTTLDDQIPALQATLQKRGVWDNTLIVFTSNGGYLLGKHGLWGDATASDPVNMYEEVVHTPLIWTCPSRFPPQTVRNEVVSSYDLMPALSELAGVAAPAGGQGPSYLPFVYGRHLGKKQTWPDLAFGRIRDAEMARDDRYKLILRNQGKGANELYDETADPKELTNQADEQKFVGMRQRLTGQLTAWRGAPKAGA
ncbi:MAG TPA: sulfatase-like hydrolase/transferase [Bryobacteraceae bacterium]|jgi:arylsulfatase A-like enzyme|nr:sulfatase-like hydrolase/transferase [Bryobacteraceae bacterium]